ncbi:MAG: DUF1848 family protein [Anaerolineae bacterium]
MAFAYRFEHYQRYQALVGSATYIDISRRTDPARIQGPWENLHEILSRCGAPWVVQVWTKDPAGVLALGGTLLEKLVAQGSTLAVQLTVTGLGGSNWEPLAPLNAFQTLPALADLAGGMAHITWRYDPIIPTVHRTERFAALAAQAAALGIRRAVTNFLAAPGRYARVDRRLRECLPGWVDGMPDYTPAWRAQVAGELVAIAAAHGLTLACCAESAALAQQVPGLEAAACGDYRWFCALSGQDPGEVASAGSRQGCGCARYFDVGNYGQWARCHRCAYCYAG